MKTTILILLVFCAVVARGQQYYKVVRFDETEAGMFIRINSTVTSCYVDKYVKKPHKDKRKDLLKMCIKELRAKDSVFFAANGKKGVLPKYYDDSADK